MEALKYRAQRARQEFERLRRRLEAAEEPMLRFEREYEEAKRDA